jgi:hypothetical protein
MIRAIAMRFGYVESNTLSWLVFQAEVAFNSKKEAFHSLAEFVYQRYLESNHPPEECCKEAAKDPANNYCSVCGIDLSSWSFDYLDWEDDLEGYRVGTIDGSYYTLYPDNPAGWDPANFVFTIPRKNMMFIHENGAQMLGFAIAELHHELKDNIHSRINKCFYDDYQELLHEGKY